jgi:sec-independent protein translocase protein TatC
MSDFFKKIRSATNPNAEMSFVDHLEALRWHLVRSSAVIITLALTAFVFKDVLFDAIIFGPKKTDFWTYRKLCEISNYYNLDAGLCIDKINFTIMNNTMAGQFNLHLTAAFYAGFIMGFPYLLFELWNFIKPGLSKKERGNARGLIFYGSFLFLTGILFGYFIINQITLDSYLSTVAILTMATGLVFELPIVIYFLSKIGIMTPKFMRSNRRIAFFLIILIAAFITPTPDAPTLLLVAAPLYLLYEISIFVSARVVKRKKIAEDLFYQNN